VVFFSGGVEKHRFIEIYSRSSQGGQAGSEPAGGTAGSYLMFLGDGGHLRWGSFAIGDLCDGGPESFFLAL